MKEKCSSTLVLGYNCNNNCIYCLYGDNKKEGDMSTKEVKKALEEIKKETSTISFSGGDVTIRADFFQLLEYTKNLGFNNISIETNGRMFSNNEFAEKTLKIIPNVTFSISPTHINPKIHDKITRVNGSWKQTIKGIKNLVGLGNRNIMIAFVVCKFNYNILPSAVEFFNDLGVRRIDFILVRKSGYARENYDNIAVRIKEIKQYLFKAFDKGYENNINVSSYGFPFCCLGNYKHNAFELGLIKSKLQGNEVIFRYRTNTEKHFDERLKGRRVKIRVCKKCKYYDLCEGIWNGYIETFGVKEFKPLRGKEINNLKELLDDFKKEELFSNKDALDVQNMAN